jgi:hypothetical protein
MSRRKTNTARARPCALPIHQTDRKKHAKENHAAQSHESMPFEKNARNKERPKQRTPETKNARNKERPKQRTPETKNALSTIKFSNGFAPVKSLNSNFHRPQSIQPNHL